MKQNLIKFCFLLPQERLKKQKKQKKKQRKQKTKTSELKKINKVKTKTSEIIITKKSKKCGTSEINDEVPNNSTLHKQTKHKDKDINEVGETSSNKITHKVEKVGKVELTLLPTRIEKEGNNKSIKTINKIQNKNKTINIISSKIDEYIFFDVIDKIDDEETQRQYLQNLKNLILTENTNKTEEIRPT